MKSTIKIDVGLSNEPIIRVALCNDYSDLRDKMLARFFENMSHNSNYLRVDFWGAHGNEREAFSDIEIRPAPLIEHVFSGQELVSLIELAKHSQDKEPFQILQEFNLRNGVPVAETMGGYPIDKSGIDPNKVAQSNG